MKTIDKQKLNTWQKVVEAYQELTKVLNRLEEVGCLTPDGLLDRTVWKMFETMLDAVDPAGDLAWFIYDNDCGNSNKKRPGGKKHIGTLRALLGELGKEEANG